MHHPQSRVVTSGSGYVVDRSATSFRLNQEITIMDRTIYEGLSLGAIKLVLMIQQDLELNNPLWEHISTNSKGRAHLAELKRKDIIEQIGLTDMYIVNPAKIRRGHPLVALGALYEYCKKRYEADKHWKITNADVRALRNTGAAITPLEFPE